MGSSERTVATSFLFVSNNFGSTIGFVLGPALVATPDDMPRYLWVQLGLAMVAFVAAMAYYPQAPPSFPSKAALQMAAAEVAPEGSEAAEQLGFWRSVADAMKNRSFVLLALSSGLLQGVFNSWTGVLSTVLPFGDTTCGWFSFSGSIAGVVAGLLIGPFARRPGWNRRLRAMILALTTASIAVSAWFLLASSESIFSDKPIIPGECDGGGRSSVHHAGQHCPMQLTSTPRYLFSCVLVRLECVRDGRVADSPRSVDRCDVSPRVRIRGRVDLPTV
jgi:membrane associated rhomboid family serine protease